MSVKYAGELSFDFGEERHVKTIVKPVCDTELPFEIKNARYELLAGEEMEAEGECAVSGHELDVFLRPLKKTAYKLRLIYEIADEVWVDIVRIKVV